MIALIERDLSAVIKFAGNLTAIPADTGTGPYWVPVEFVIDDQTTGALPQIMDPETQQITSTKVIITQVRRDMNTTELAAYDDEVADTIEVNGIDRAIGQILFQLVNDVRVLQGQSTITASQFRNYIKTLIRS